MKNTELVKSLLDDTIKITDTYCTSPFGTSDEFKKEVFKALVKLTAERGIKETPDLVLLNTKENK